MIDERPGLVIAIGAVLEVISVIGAWLLFLFVEEFRSLPLDLLVFAMSVAGLYLGIIGGMTYVKKERIKRAAGNQASGTNYIEQQIQNETGPEEKK